MDETHHTGDGMRVPVRPIPFPLACIAGILLCILLLSGSRTFAASASVAGQEGKPILRVGYFQLPPHAYADPQGKATGAAVELLTKHIAPAMGVTVEMVGPIPLPRLKSEATARTLDALLLVHTPDYETRFSYPAQPFWSMAPALAVATTSTITDTAFPPSLSALTIGYVSNAWIHPSIPQSGARIDFATGINADQSNLHKLASGRINAVFSTDFCSLQCTILHSRFKEHVRPVHLPVAPEPIYTVFRKDMPRDIITRYENALQQTLRTTSYKAMQERYIRAFADSPLPQ